MATNKLGDFLELFVGIRNNCPIFIRIGQVVALKKPYSIMPL